MEKTLEKCPECDGEGQIAIFDRVEPGAPLYHADDRECAFCKGTGEIESD